jgi:hypothetical protein
MMQDIKTIDLQNEPCPLNLVKFKFYFYDLKSFIALVKKGKQSEGIIDFLNYKKATFKIIQEENLTKIIVNE